MAIYYRLMHLEEANEVCRLVNAVFDKYVAPDYSAEGIAEFRKYNRPEEVIRRSSADHFVLVATKKRKIIGVIEIRNNRHVSLLFVASDFHGQGIGRQLWDRAFQKSRDVDPAGREFTVNSSPYAVPIYEKLGFRRTSPEQIHNGLRFVPMTLTF
jgi:GNAT superfamily N-acetyltransferase